MIVTPVDGNDSDIVEKVKNSIIEIPDGRGGTQRLALLVVSHSSDAERISNVQINIKRNLPRLRELPGLFLKRGEPLAILGGGPSLKDNLDKIKQFKYTMVAGSPHDFLIQNGIVSSFAVATDAIPDSLRHYQHPHKDTSYLLASQCPPELFDRLEGHKVCLWHFLGQIDEKHYNGEGSNFWGCMVGVNCIQMAFWLGFQELHFFGFDCSLTDTETHSYDVTEYADLMSKRTLATVGEEKNQFWTTAGLLAQVEHFLEIFRSTDGYYLKGYVYGPGLLADVIRQTDMRPWLEAA